MKFKSRKKLGPSTTFYTGHDGKLTPRATLIRVSKHAKAKQPQAKRQ
jgi:hypothetical protein